MKTVEQNMDKSGFGPVMEVKGYIYRDTSPQVNGGPDADTFFPAGFDVPRHWKQIEPAVCRFQEFKPGGPGRAQYVRHPFAGFKSAKMVAKDGPGNQFDRRRDH